MKTQVSFLVVICPILLLIDSCAKVDVIPQGAWKVVNDSTYVGVGLNNHLQGYQGQPGDYFDFAANGNLYIREGSTVDTLSYQYLSNGKLYMIGFTHFTINGNSSDTCTVSQTATSMRIASQLFPTPGGTFGRIVNLSK
jgi:hypothetical protein